MFETPQPALGDLARPVDLDEIARTLDEVRALDPELFEHPVTLQLVEMGAQASAEVTEDFGTPDGPKWHVGAVEERAMTYHNGGEDGHTSAGEKGSGVPRAAVLIAKAVNEAAGHEVYDPISRAVGYNAGANHDRDQNCGRALLPEGQQGEGYGDERLSAEAARDDYLTAGGDPAIAQRLYDSVMVTAFNPETKTQNINHEAWRTSPDDPDLQQIVLGQELMAAADLLSLTHVRGPVGAVENVVESLCSNQSGRALQGVLSTRGLKTTGVTSIGELLDVIGENDALRAKFTEMIDGQSKFFGGFQFSDEAIQTVCGHGIDELFPGRANNIAELNTYTEALRSEERSPKEVWQQARSRAGYED